jgi:hypothetical protein
MPWTNRHVNQHLAEDYRGIKPWYRPRGWFKQGSDPTRVCRTCAEVRTFLRQQLQRHPPSALAQRRRIQQDRSMRMLAAA